MSLQMAFFHSFFLRPSNMPLYVCAFFIHSFINGQLKLFPYLGYYKNSAAVSTGAHVFLQVIKSIFIFFG